MSNWLSRLVFVGVQIWALKTLGKELTAEEFAAYAIMASLMPWYQLLDFGYGSSIQNKVSACMSNLAPEFGYYIAATGLLGMSILVAAAILLIPLSYPIGHLLLGKLDLSTQGGLLTLVWLSGVLFVGNALGVMAQKVLYGLRKGIYANLMIMLSSLIFMVLLEFWLPGSAPRDRLFISVISYTLPIGALGVTVLLYVTVRFGRFNWDEMKRRILALRPEAQNFWIFAVLSAGVLNVDYLIMSQTVSAVEIATYTVLYRIYWVLLAVYGGLMSASWPLFTELGVEGAYTRIDGYVKWYILGGLSVLMLATIVIYFLLPFLVRILVPSLVPNVSLLTLVLFSVYIGLRIWTDTYAMVLQAIGQVGTLLRVISVQVLVSVVSQYALSYWLGLDGIILGLIASFVLTVAWYMPQKYLHVRSLNKGERA